jgi:hypothetical protein
MSATDVCDECFCRGADLPFCWGNDPRLSVSHSRPIFTSFWDFEFETGIWDSPGWNYDW